MDPREKRLQRRWLKAAQRVDGKMPRGEKVAEMRRVRAEQCVEPTQAQLEMSAARKRLKAAKPIQPPSPERALLLPDEPRKDMRGIVLAAMLLISPFAYWLSNSAQETGAGPVPGQASDQLESESHQQKMEELDREIASRRDRNRRTEQDNLNREAQRLSEELRSQGIGISPAEAGALLQTEKELMGE